MYNRVLMLATMSLALTGCVSPQISANDFSVGASLEQTAFSELRVDRVDVVIPDKMPVSANPGVRYPSQDTLVWWEDPPGDRKAQVRRLVAEAVQHSAERTLIGAKPVRIEIFIDQFHAMTPRARSTSLQLGVHEVQFDIVISDVETDEIIASENDINADLRAFSGTSALLAEQNGQTQAVRIKARIDQVISDWLHT